MTKYVMFCLTAMFTVVFSGLVAVAGPLGLPDHQPNGYRDTGCDPAQQVQILNDAGEYLYSNNPTCPMVGGPSDDLTPDVVKKKPVEEPCEGDACEGPGDGEGGGEVVDGGDEPPVEVVASAD